jgi:hypothetical protein
MINARGISRRKRDEVRSNSTLKNYSTSKLTPPIPSSNGWRSLYHSAHVNGRITGDSSMRRLTMPVDLGRVTGKPETGTDPLGNFRVADHSPR